MLTPVPGYRLVETLYVGRRSTVMRAVRQSDGLPVVCKLLNVDAAQPAERAAFHREFAITQRLRYADVIEALDCLPHDGSLVMIFRDIGGTTLHTLIENRPMAVDRFLKMALHAVEAIGAVHDAGIVHKDICPANLVWNEAADQFNIIDFGIASELSREDAGNRGIELIEGTLSYMAPEQTGRMNRVIDYRADFYALGATFYECLVGEPPFSTQDVLELVHCHIALAPTAPSLLNPLVPEPLSALVARLMAKDPEDRYQSAIGLRADLQHCLTAFQGEGRIAPFPLATRDVRTVLRLPQKLYGRAAQAGLLRDAFDRACGGGHEILLITGYSGIGKSALVRELHKPVISCNGAFISGKCEQLRRDTPYAPLIAAFQYLVRQVLAGSAGQQAIWRARLLEALGTSGAVMTAVIPDLTRLIGTPSPLVELEPAEAHERFVYVFGKFVQTFASVGHPLVLFLDDLQWADLASLKLLEELLSESRLGYLLVVAAYRDTEVDAGHPLRHTLDILAGAGVTINEARLSGLDEEAVVAFVCDALHALPGRVRPLAALLATKTLGNPFFLGQFLEALERQGLIAFNRGLGAWTWDMAAIEAQQLGPMADDVVAFMVQRIWELPEATRTVVRSAAAIGGVFDLTTLACLCDLPTAMAARSLWPALQAGLVLPLGDAYRYAEMIDGPVRVSYRFVHDRVQQAAYSLLDPEAAQACHLAVGRVLARSAGGAGGASGEALFEIVNHLNRATALMTADEREELADLNLRAGEAARLATAYGPALRYLTCGLSLLPADAWQRQYPLTFRLHADAAELAVFQTDDETAYRLVAAIHAHARTLLDRVCGYEVLIQLHVARQNLAEALVVCKKALALLDCAVPEKATAFHVFYELIRTKLVLRRKDEQAIVAMPATEDARLLAIGRLMSKTLASAYLGDTNLFSIMVFRLVRLSATGGNQPASGIAYATYGLILNAGLGDVPGAALFGRVAMRVVDRLRADQVRAQTQFVVKLFIEPWHRPLGETVQGLLEAHRVALESGDLEYAGYCLNNSVAQHYSRGLSLQSLKAIAAEYAATIVKLRNQTALGVLLVYQQTILNLLGESADATVFAGPFVVEDVHARDMAARGNALAVEALHARLAYLGLIFGRIDEARRHRELRRRHAGAALGMVEGLRADLIGLMVDYAAWPALGRRERRQVLQTAGTVERRLKRSARHAPQTFAHLYALALAERWHVAGAASEKAWPHYRTAIETARQNGFTQDEALACERAGALALAQGDRTVARSYLQRARYAYMRWNAFAKVRHLDQHMATVFGSTTGEPADDAALPQRKPLTTLDRRTTSDSSGAHLIDVETVIRASRSLAQDIRLGDLLRSLMQIVIANAGASKGYLLLPGDDGSWRIEAEATVEGGALAVMHARPIDGANPVLAVSVVDLVMQRQEPVVLADAATDASVVYDPYVATAQPRSILCVPLRTRNRLSGILYLENNLAPGVFGPERLQLLTLLSAQIGMSIENARLYDGLERLNRTLEAQVAERTRELAEQSQLLRTALTGMSDGLAAFDAEGRLRVWNTKAIEIFGVPPALQRVGVAYRDVVEAVIASGKLRTPLDDIDPMEGPRELEFQDDRVIQVRNRPLPDGGAVHTYLDVTEDRKRERELWDAHEQLRTAHAQLQATQQQLVQAEKMASMGRLVAGMAHEINTPIGTVITSASFLGDKVEEFTVITGTRPVKRIEFQNFLDSVRLSVSLIMANISRAADLVQSFKQVAVDQTHDSRRHFDLKGYFEEALSSLSLTWNRLGHEVRLECPGDLEVDTYPGALAHILTNFITNSIIHGYDEGERGHFEVIVRRITEDMVEMVYRDDGHGIPEQHQAKVFEPFFTTRRNAGSLGLGLHIVYNLVASRLGGTVELASGTGTGTRLTVRFPVRAPVP
jgi:predicted ATPase/signal transduction histidine kinase/tRNA A-37 threonylcarbamoyl transferase component Bud32